MEEVQELIETVLEGTIFNLMREANSGEFDMTNYGILIRDSGKPTKEE